ncbi:MAG: flagellar basal-body rod protein FlgG [Sphingomonadales bacterium]
MKALSTAATGMLAQQMNVEVISNNIANMNTTAYKRQRAEFQDLLYQNIERVGAATSDNGTLAPSGIQIGVGVKAGGVYRITGQGSLTETGNPYDVAISGKGYFRVQMPDGTNSFTRAGSFQISDQGQLVTTDGFVIAPGITIPQDAIDVSINNVGQVQAQIAGQVQFNQVGQLELSNFPNEAGLEGLGDNLYRESPASGQALTGNPGAPGFGTVQQGFLEISNVNPVAEITALISAQRAYEMNSKVITTADEMMNTTSRLR